MHQLDVHDTPWRKSSPVPGRLGAVLRSSSFAPSQPSVERRRRADLLDRPRCRTLLDEHDTPPMLPPTAPAERGVYWILQRTPFHLSVKVSGGPSTSASCPSPTAVHARLDAHDTPKSSLPWETTGVFWITHLAPFQRSANCDGVSAVGDSPLVKWKVPTAVHALLDEHDTPLKSTVWPDSLGVVCIAHLTPFHRSTSAAPATDPTAIQAFLQLQTPPGKRRLECEPSACSEPSSQRRSIAPPTSCRRSRVWLVWKPTAMQAVLDVHDTPERL